MKSTQPIDQTDAKMRMVAAFNCDPEMHEAIKARGTRTETSAAYMRRIIAADLAGHSMQLPNGVQEDILARLGSLYRPRIAAQLAELLTRAQIDQPALLERLLLELFDTLTHGIPAASIHISDTPHVTPLDNLPPLPLDEIAKTKKLLAADVAAARARLRIPQK